MTDKTLQQHYDKNKRLYQSLVETCSSADELLLKVSIFKGNWTCWDWVLLFKCLACMPYDKKLLLNDMLETLQTSDELDDVLSNRLVVINLTYCVTESRMMSQYEKKLMCAVLAQAFKKFRGMWNASWMYAKSYDAATKKWRKRHRLSSFTQAWLHQNKIMSSSFTDYDAFQAEYGIRTVNNNHEEDKT